MATPNRRNEARYQRVLTRLHEEMAELADMTVESPDGYAEYSDRGSVEMNAQGVTVGPPVPVYWHEGTPECPTPRPPRWLGVDGGRPGCLVCGAVGAPWVAGERPPAYMVATVPHQPGCPHPPTAYLRRDAAGYLPPLD